MPGGTIRVGALSQFGRTCPSTLSLSSNSPQQHMIWVCNWLMAPDHLKLLSPNFTPTHCQFIVSSIVVACIFGLYLIFAPMLLSLVWFAGLMFVSFSVCSWQIYLPQSNQSSRHSAHCCFHTHAVSVSSALFQSACHTGFPVVHWLNTVSLLQQTGLMTTEHNSYELHVLVYIWNRPYFSQVG